MKIGWGKADITPIGKICKKVSLVGQFEERITETVRDPIFATALAIEDSIVISLDLLSTPDSYMAAAREKIKKLIPDFPPENLIMAATHIHTGPMLESDLLAQWWGERFARLPEDPDVVTPDVYKKFAAERIASAA
ncbi:MAG: hypothetical protein FWF15_10700, partial [Oscillospiraceae bacterium]|nr:hypothetical protein [Oscillospiraceae bacterium]